jgi:PAS domain S-box-containing protein
MKIRSLRHLLAIRSAWIAAVPFLLSAILGWFWLRPEMIADTEAHQRQLATVIASRTEDYLVASSVAIERTASVFSKGLVGSNKVQEYLDTVLASSMNLTSLTFTDRNGRITAIALPRERAPLRQEMTGIDLSLTSAVRQVRASGRPAWSDAYLSPVGGELAVAYATPAGEGVALGEIALARLSGFLGGIAAQGKHAVFIIDRRGQVIADQEGRYTARQYNLTNIEIVREGLASGRPMTRTFSFDGERFVGSLIRAPLLDWSILVASPVGLAYRSALTTTGIFATALCLALLLAAGLSLLISHFLASRLERLVSHARRIESGEDAGEWPKAPVREFNLLGEALHSMANTLRERENRLNVQLLFLQQLLDSIPLPVYYKDTGGLYLGCNAAFETFIGMPRRDIVGKTVYDVVPKERADKHHEADLALFRHPGAKTYELSGIYSDGESHEVISNKATFFDAENRVAGIVGALIDITERKRAEETIRTSLAEKEVLLKEVHHRVKNNLQIISSLLELQSDYIPDELSRACLRESQNRIRSMSLIHEWLYGSKNFSSIDAGEYISDLSQFLFNSYMVETARVSLILDAGNICLDINQAVPCGLIINELISNSLKHGFPDGRSGEISVRVSSEEGRITLQVADNGVGMPAGLDSRNTESLGLQLVNLLARQLRGSISFDGGAKGTVAVISFQGTHEAQGEKTEGMPKRSQ